MHGVYEDSHKDIRVRNVQIAIETAIASAEANPQKRRRLNDTEPTTAFEPDVAEILYVKFIAVCNQPLRLVECPEFRAFLVYLNEDITTWLPDSHQTIRTWVLRQYDIERERIKSRIQNARSKVHISCDLWTSPNDFAILGILAHYISEDNQLEHSVLALVEITGPHEGENLAPQVIKVVEDWGIVSKLGFFVMDNAGNNDTMMRHISLGKQVSVILLYKILIRTALLQKYGIKYDPKHHRLRCQGHILNLCVNSFLFVTDDESLEQDDDEEQAASATLEESNSGGSMDLLASFIISSFTSKQLPSECTTSNSSLTIDGLLEITKQDGIRGKRCCESPSRTLSTAPSRLTFSTM
jgi:hypothetical protein